MSRHITASVAIALSVASGAFVLTVSDGASVAAGERTWYVAPGGSDAAGGAADAPLATLASAVDRAASGDSIVLSDGVYRESVQVYGKELHISSAPGERAVLDGARTVDSWTASNGDWVSGGWTTQFDQERSGGPVSSSRTAAGYPDQVFFNGVSMQQVFDRSAVEPGTFFHDTGNDQLWIGSDPAGQRVEASDLGWGLYFNRADGSSLTDVTLRRFATEASDMAALRVYSNDIAVSGVIVRANARIGLSAIGSRIFVTDSRFTDNGYLGVHGNQLDGFVLQNSAVHANNAESFDPFHSAGGVKLTNSSGITIRDNHISGNDGPGVWTDLDTSGVTIVRNLVEDNTRAGIEIELSDRVNVLSNVTLDNGEAGIWAIESQNVQIMHNASFGNVNAIEIEEGPRRDVANIRVENNTMGNAAPGSRALLDINDWTENRSAWEMGVSIGYNAYWAPDSSATDAISRFGRWPNSLAFANHIESHQANTGQGISSTMSTSSVNPYVHSLPTDDFRWLESIGAGSSLTPGAAEALGVAEGDRLGVGPVAPVVRR